MVTSGPRTIVAGAWGQPGAPADAGAAHRRLAGRRCGRGAADRVPCAVARPNDGMAKICDGMAERVTSLYITVSPCKMSPCAGVAADQKAASFASSRVQLLRHLRCPACLCLTGSLTIRMLQSHCCNTHTSCRKSNALRTQVASARHMAKNELVTKSDSSTKPQPRQTPNNDHRHLT
jgi:hypothetical protein